MNKHDKIKEYLCLSNTGIKEYYNFAKSRHEQEIERSKNIRSIMATFVSISTILFGAFLLSFKDISFHVNNIILTSVLLITYLTGVKVSWILIKSFEKFYFGFKYAFPPDIESTKNVIKNQEKHFRKYHSLHYNHYGSLDEVTQKAAKIMFANKFSEIAEYNYKTNTNKIDIVIKLWRKVIYLFVIVGVIFLINTYNGNNKNDNHKTIVEELIIMDDEERVKSNMKDKEIVKKTKLSPESNFDKSSTKPKTRKDQTKSAPENNPETNETND